MSNEDNNCNELEEFSDFAVHECFDHLYRPQQFKSSFDLPSGEWRIDTDFAEDFFLSAKALLEGILSRQDETEGASAIFLCRHYVELGIKYALFHARWLKGHDTIAELSDVEEIDKTHDLNSLWKMLNNELAAKPGVAPSELDLKFVGKFVNELHAVDKNNWRFRYPMKTFARQPTKSLLAKRPALLAVNFESLLASLERTREILAFLDDYLINTYQGALNYQVEDCI